MLDLRDANTKVRRAKVIWNELVVILREWAGGNGIHLALKSDPCLALDIWYIYKVREPSESLEAISGDILDNLRNALDYIAWQIFILGGGDSAQKRAAHVYFPIVEDEEKWNNALKTKVPNAWLEAAEALRECQPFNESDPKNSELMLLQGLNSKDKHRQLSIVAVGDRGFSSRRPSLPDDLGVSLGLAIPGPKLELNIGNEIARRVIFRSNTIPPDISDLAPRELVPDLEPPSKPTYELNLRNGEWEMGEVRLKDLIEKVYSIVKKFETIGPSASLSV